MSQPPLPESLALTNHVIQTLAVHVTPLSLRLPPKRFWCEHGRVYCPEDPYEFFCLKQIFATKQVHPEDVDFILELEPSLLEDIERLRLLVCGQLKAGPYLLGALYAYLVKIGELPDHYTILPLLEDYQSQDPTVLASIKKFWYNKTWAWLRLLPHRTSLYSEAALKRHGMYCKTVNDLAHHFVYSDVDTEESTAQIPTLWNRLS